MGIVSDESQNSDRESSGQDETYDRRLRQRDRSRWVTILIFAVAFFAFVAWRYYHGGGSLAQTVAPGLRQPRWEEVVPVTKTNDGAAGVMSVLTLPDGRVFTASSDGNLVGLNSEKLSSALFALQAPHSVNSLAAAGNYLFIGGSEGSVVMQPFNQGEGSVVLGRFSAGPALSLDVSPDSRLLVAGGMDGQTFVWNIATHSLVTSFQSDGAVVLARFLGPTSLVTVTYLGIVQRHELPSGTTSASPIELPVAAVVSAALNQDKRTLAIGGQSFGISSGSVILVDLVSQQIVASLPDVIGDINAVAFSHDGMRLAFCDDRRIGVYEVLSKSARGLPLGSGHHCSSVSFSSNNHDVLVGETDGKLYRFVF